MTRLVPEKGALPVKVNVLLTVAACTPAVISSARAKGADLLKVNAVTKRIIMSPPHRTLDGPAFLHYTLKPLET